ncbi:MAG TPA: hypothetical protein VK548_11700 [Candidatus Acidoferrum sp.]|nr:hypothetical protein [Candidatus Acidoferrum sp.]
MVMPRFARAFRNVALIAGVVGGSVGCGSGIVVHGVTFGPMIAPGFPPFPPVVSLNVGSVPAYRAPRAGTIQNFRVFVDTNDLMGANVVVTLYVNGVATSITATIPIGFTGGVDSPNTVAVSNGDVIEVKADRTGTTGSGPSGPPGPPAFVRVSTAYELR